MTTATETTHGVKPKALIGSCGGCTYNYNSGTKCYDRNGAGGCTGKCRCAPTICGLGSQIIEILHPTSATSAASLSLNCGMAANDEHWLALALINLAQQQLAAARRRWKAASIVLGVLSVLLAVGLAVSLINR